MMSYRYRIESDNRDPQGNPSLLQLGRIGSASLSEALDAIICMAPKMVGALTIWISGYTSGDSKALAVTKRIRVSTTVDAVPYIHRPDVFETPCPGVESSDSSEDGKATYCYWLRSASDPETDTWERYGRVRSFTISGAFTEAVARASQSITFRSAPLKLYIEGPIGPSYTQNEEAQKIVQRVYDIGRVGKAKDQSWPASLPVPAHDDTLHVGSKDDA